ncbi:MAG: hypothetical protein JSV66_16710 [Trueperaceae bacterium]|nr:MAG: hypothetical protein JSV66_16710 [Trueperaceae bacterium]
MRGLFAIFTVFLLLTSCAPTVKNVRQQVSGVKNVAYQADGWEIVQTLAELAPLLQPSGAHTFYEAHDVSDRSVTLSARPIGGGAMFSDIRASRAQALSITVSIADQGGYVVVIFENDPPRDPTARSARDDLIAEIDARFRRFDAES